MQNKNIFTQSRKAFLSQLPNESLKKSTIKTILLFSLGWIIAIFVAASGLILLQDYLKVDEQFLLIPVTILQDFSLIIVTLGLFYRFNLRKSVESLRGNHKTTKYRRWLIIGDITFITLIPLCLYSFLFISNKTQAAIFFETIANQGVDTLSADHILMFCYQVIFLFAAAFAEEFIFRHTIYRHFRRYSFFGALFISSFLFYLVHGQLFHLGFISGIVWGIYYEYTNDFKGIVITHALNNLAISFSWFYLAHLFLLLE